MIKTWLARLEKRVESIIEKDYTPAPFSFEQLLVGCSNVYKAAARLRITMYRSGLFKQKKLPCKVISIGNVAVGGSGKTPMTIHLAEMLIEHGLHPVVVSRGYKGKLDKPASVVGDGTRVLMDTETAGDEPFMMAMRKRFPVVVGKDRYTAGRLAIDTFNPDVIILDDGFQHLSLDRDVNLVLFDCKRPFGNKRVLPAGRLRETMDMAKSRISGAIFTRCRIAEGTTGSADKHKAGFLDEFDSLPVFYSCHAPFLADYYSNDQSDKIPTSLEDLEGQKVVLFSGIAKNVSFKETVARQGIKVLDHLEFEDHYRYKRADFLSIRNRADEVGADAILTTEKDWVKMDPAFAWKMNIGIIGVRIMFSDPQAFETFIISEHIHER